MSAALSVVHCNSSEKAAVQFLSFHPPVTVPELGFVEMELTGDATAIIRTFRADGDIAEVRLQNALIQDGVLCRVIQTGGNQA